MTKIREMHFAYGKHALTIHADEPAFAFLHKMNEHYSDDMGWANKDEVAWQSQGEQTVPVSEAIQIDETKLAVPCVERQIEEQGLVFMYQDDPMYVSFTDLGLMAATGKLKHSNGDDIMMPDITDLKQNLFEENKGAFRRRSFKNNDPIFAKNVTIQVLKTA